MKQVYESKRDQQRKQEAEAYERGLADIRSRRAELSYQERQLLEEGSEREIADRVLERWRLWLWIASAIVTPFFLFTLWHQVWLGALVVATAYLHPILGYRFARRTSRALARAADRTPKPASASVESGTSATLDLRETYDELEREYDEPVRFGDRELMRDGHPELVHEALNRRRAMRFLLFLPITLFYGISFFQDGFEEPRASVSMLAVFLLLVGAQRVWEIWREQQPSRES